MAGELLPHYHLMGFAPSVVMGRVAVSPSRVDDDSNLARVPQQLALRFRRSPRLSCAQLPVAAASAAGAPRCAGVAGARSAGQAPRPGVCFLWPGQGIGQGIGRPSARRRRHSGAREAGDADGGLDRLIGFGVSGTPSPLRPRQLSSIGFACRLAQSQRVARQERRKLEGPASDAAENIAGRMPSGLACCEVDGVFRWDSHDSAIRLNSLRIVLVVSVSGRLSRARERHC